MKIIKKIKNWLNLYTSQKFIDELENRRSAPNDRAIVIKLDAIGDFIIWLDSAKEYKELYPNYKFTLLCNSACESIAESVGYFDDIVSINIRRFETDKEYKAEIIEMMGVLEFALLIQASYSRTIHMDIIAASIPAHKKIGFVSDESKSNVSRNLVKKKRKAILDKIYDNLIATSPETVMELKRNGEFIEKLGKRNFITSTPKLEISKNISIPEDSYFVVIPGASSKIKMWSPEKYAEIIDFLIDKTGWSAYICGGKEENYLFDKIIKKVSYKEKVINYFGKTSLVELAEIIRNSKLVISNDTGGIHIAAATNAPAVCVFGEYNYGRFLPYDSAIRNDKIEVCSANMRCRNCSSGRMSVRCLIHILLTGRYLCLDKVTVDMVRKKITEITEQ